MDVTNATSASHNDTPCVCVWRLFLAASHRTIASSSPGNFQPDVHWVIITYLTRNGLDASGPGAVRGKCLPDDTQGRFPSCDRENWTEIKLDRSAMEGDNYCDNC